MFRDPLKRATPVDKFLPKHIRCLMHKVPLRLVSKNWCWVFATSFRCWLRQQYRMMFLRRFSRWCQLRDYQIV